MIMANLPIERREALEGPAAFSAGGFCRPVPGHGRLPVIIRLIDPPLHEFLPRPGRVINELADLKLRVNHAATLAEIDHLLQQIRTKERIRRQAERLHEQNPMLGMRGVRLGIQIPELTHAGARHLSRPPARSPAKASRCCPR
jgi:pyruvate, orthophosphate dikinase